MSTSTQATAPADLRRDIYYWKCDRPVALHGVGADVAHREAHMTRTRASLERILRARFGAVPADLRAGGGQGNHLMFRATIQGRDCMIRIEDGPERDDYMEVEAHVIGLVRAAGVPSWNFLGVDSSRREADFAWQIIERVPGADLNALLKAGSLDLLAAAKKIGAHVARWQAVRPPGYGPFQPTVLREACALMGFHATYAGYFHTRLEEHVGFLRDRGFLAREEAAEIVNAIATADPVLRMVDSEGGCLVHKDLALWNIVGEAPDRISAVIDWDDTVSGDPMDDLSLLACFYDGAVVGGALAGYASVRTLPARHVERFWLHLLRNMLWKSVIRVGAGYFDVRPGADFFLTASAGDGRALRDFTLGRIRAAVRGLREHSAIDSL